MYGSVAAMKISQQKRPALRRGVSASKGSIQWTSYLETVHQFFHALFSDQ